MDYCTLESEVIDTLEFLRPSVKRNNLFKSKRNIVVNSTHSGRKINHKEITTYNNTPKVKEPVESSNYIHKETTEKRVLEQHSLVTYTSVFKHKRQILPVPTVKQNISKGKPLIQVTVIPKTELIQTEKFSKRRRRYPKVQSSHSNQENSINAKNVYVVTAGKTREKINEIKTTASAKFLNKRIIKVIKHEENISNCKQLLESLNMEVKKKRDKRKKKPPKVEGIDDNTREKCYDCGCWENARNEIQPDLRQHKSRVRIYGRVGLSQDDRYVVDCAATVDENPMHTINYSPIEHNPEVSSIFVASNDHPRFRQNINKLGCSSGLGNNYRPYQRDFNAQTDVRNDVRVTQCFPFEANRLWIGKESQGTQVNFNIPLTNVNNRNYYRTKEQQIQCDCHNLIGTSSLNQTKNKVEESQSPLVIISVYPKQESTDVIKTVTYCKGSNTAATAPSKSPTPSPARTRVNSPKRIKEIQSSKAVCRSRSPSPVAKNLYKRKDDTNKKLEETKVFRASKKQVSPNYQSTQESQNMRKVNRKSVVANKQNNTCKTEAIWHAETNGNHAAEKRTEQMLAKQALVNDFTKRITESMNRRPTCDLNTVKNGKSKVTVNINSENEYYDVMFQQGKLTTDLSVRRNKKVSPRKNYDQMDGTRSPPPTGFEKESDGNWRNKQANAGIHEQNISRLNVRDSLEILHRRDTEQNTSVTKPYSRHKRRYDNAVDNQFLAPIKHYKGDDCNLPNPIERDKQIRELLGIEHRIASSSETRQFLYSYSTKKLAKPDEEHTEDQQITTKNTRENSTQYDQGPVERNLYQQLILNRNVQVFLQVDQFNKQKPIILSRQQYDKVKRTIQDTINKKGGGGSKDKKCFCKTSMVSIGEVREKTKQEVTEPIEKGVQATRHKETKVDGTKSLRLLDWMKKDKDNPKNIKNEVRALVLFNSNEKTTSSDSKKSKNLNTIPRKTVSSIEIRYANLGMKRVQFSQSNLESEITSHIGQPRSDSLVTIYKVSGPRKSLTPNLGTSIISEGVSNTKSVQFLMAPKDVKEKKPFLQRLISCLVVHSTRDTALKTPHKPIPLTPSANSSIDSYQISSSLGEIEITSSLYDTSASFYSNHSILHVNSKMKRVLLNMSLLKRCVPVIPRIIRMIPLTLQSQKIHRWVAPTLMELKRREDKLGGKKINPRNTFLEWNLEAEIYAFGKRLNEDFDSDLLLLAFTDRSYVIKEEMKQKELGIKLQMKDNRELAEDGQKVMNEYIQLYLEAVLPKFPMEGIACIKNHLLGEGTLAHVSSYLGTKDIILASEYPVDNYILANTFKAIVGALLRCSGQESAAHFVRDFVITQLQGQDVNEYWHIEDPWLMLSGFVEKDGAKIEPRLIGEVGKNTLLACYRVGLYVDKKMISSGFGEKISIAKEMAAREALKKIFGTEDHMKPINFQLTGIPKPNSEARYQIAAS
ncbi:hypothetical protein K1T71_011274 [Dendrolimus kikuchii]|uniref:Uncharacterized protein n=1 Tax=Dendrolimus kikuchii TaxID=765133 RepID=A0ACC1CNI4_9NEOP|nr:hypothetical protein K1T71_011274 [Dendrolimus kikuchii]